MCLLARSGPQLIEGNKWFDQISSQWESQKNRFALIYSGKSSFYLPAFEISVYVVLPPVNITGGRASVLLVTGGRWRGGRPLTPSPSRCPSLTFNNLQYCSTDPCYMRVSFLEGVMVPLCLQNVYSVVMATLAKRKRTKASIMVFSSISKRSEHLR